MREQRTALVIDDEPLISQVACIRLRGAGYHTIKASDGEEGVAAAAEMQPDVILLDVRMPHMDGLTALRRLRSQAGTRRIPVVMLSASLIDKRAALDAGARFFLSKPYDAKNLIAAVNKAVEEARLDKANEAQ